MSSSRVEPSPGVSDLLAIPDHARAAWLTARGEPDDALLAFGDEIERLAVADPEKAMEAAQAATVLADEIGSDRARVRIRRAATHAMSYAGRFEDALAVCAEAIALAERSGEAIEGARCRLASLHALANLGRFNDALAAGEQARDAFAVAGETELAARANLNLGAVHAMRDEPRAALAALDRARPALLTQPSILAQLDANRGNALIALDDHRGAETAFASAATAFETAGETLASAITASNRAVLAARRGRLQDALALFEHARALFDQSGSPAHVARMRAEQAETLATLGLPGDALAQLELAILELDRLGLAAEAARARVTLGRALIASERIDEADAPLADAETQLSGLNLTVDRARVLLLQAQLALLRGEAPVAADLADAALADIVDRPVDRALALSARARIALAMGDLPLAEQSLLEAESIANQYTLTPLLAELGLMRGWLLHGCGEDPLPAFVAAVDAAERVRETLQASRFRSAFHADRMAPYTEMLAAALRADETAVAFRAAELVKSRGLLDVVGGALQREETSEGDDDLTRELDEIRTELNWRYSQIDAPSSTSRSIADLELVMARLEERRAVRRPAPLYSASPATVADMYAMLRPNEAAVSYVFDGDHLTAFVFRDNHVVCRRAIARFDDLHDAARRLRFQINRAVAKGQESAGFDRRQVDVQRELAGLWNLLMAPIRADLDQVDRLTVAPHSLLHAMPFSALWDGAHYLTERMEVVTVPSLSLWTHLPPRPVRADRSAVIGSPDELTPAIAGEVHRVAAALQTERVAVGSSATAARAIGDLQSSTTIHFACHGRFVREHPRASGLKLADRWLSLAEISALSLPASHVTLSACDTGRSAVAAGDELVGLVAGFYSAGARSLIHTLWPIDDAAAAELMDELYRRRRDGASFAEALRAAQRHLISQQAHPAFWAPFVFGGTA